MATKSKRPMTVAEQEAALDRIEEHIASIREAIEVHLKKSEARKKRLEKAAGKAGTS